MELVEQEKAERHRWKKCADAKTDFFRTTRSDINDEDPNPSIRRWLTEEFGLDYGSLWNWKE